MTARSNRSAQLERELPAVVMDPRIRRRRVSVRRQQGRHRLKILTVLVATIAVVIAGWVATRSPLLDVDHISVDGTIQTAPSDVLKASGIAKGSAMLDVDAGRARRDIEALPWVRSATVERQWPGTVKVTVSERSAAAVMANSAGGLAFVDDTGRVLAWLSSAPPAGMVALLGVAPAGAPGSVLPASAGGLLSVARSIPRSLRPAISAIVQGTDGVELHVAQGGSILIGSIDDLGTKLDAAQKVIEGVDLSNLSVLDVRQPTAPTVTRSGP